MKKLIHKLEFKMFLFADEQNFFKSVFQTNEDISKVFAYIRDSITINLFKLNNVWYYFIRKTS